MWAIVVVLAAYWFCILCIDLKSESLDWPSEPILTEDISIVLDCLHYMWLELFWAPSKVQVLV